MIRTNSRRASRKCSSRSLSSMAAPPTISTASISREPRNTWLVATSTASWSYFATGLNAGNLVNGASYRIHAHSVDVAGNIDVVSATSTFVFDTDTPISTVTVPSDGSVQLNPADIAGTASDVGPAGIQKVQISLRLDNAPTSQTAGSEDFYLDPSSYSIVNQSSFTSTSEVWIDASGSTNWNFATTGIWKSGKRYWAKARAIDRAGNVQTNTSIGNGNNFIVSLPASAFQVIVDTSSPITAGTSRNITVNAVDSATPPNISITFIGTVQFSIDSGGTRISR